MVATSASALATTATLPLLRFGAGVELCCHASEQTLGISRFQSRRQGATLERRMPSYLAESYLANSPDALDCARERAALAAELGVGVRYVRTTFLPDDETVLHLFEAPSAAVLDEAGRRAALPFERIVEAVEVVPRAMSEES